MLIEEHRSLLNVHLCPLPICFGQTLIVMQGGPCVKLLHYFQGKGYVSYEFSPDFGGSSAGVPARRAGRCASGPSARS